MLFGNDMATALKLAASTGVKDTAQVVVPNITLGMAESAGPEAMAGVVGATPWEWEIPYKYNFEKGKEFVEKFAGKYGTYPSTSAASAYTILYEYKAAVERASSFEGADVVRALEGHEYQLLKDPQRWRAFDHQSVQTVYAVRGKPAQEVHDDKYKLDYFDIISNLSGPDAVVPRDEWLGTRRAAGKPAELESLPR